MSKTPRTVEDRIFTALDTAIHRIKSTQSTLPSKESVAMHTLASAIHGDTHTLLTEKELIITQLSRAIRQQISAFLEQEAIDIFYNRLEKDSTETRHPRLPNKQVAAAVTKYVTKAIEHRKINTLEDLEKHAQKGSQSLATRLVDKFETMLKDATVQTPDIITEYKPVIEKKTATTRRRPRKQAEAEASSTTITSDEKSMVQQYATKQKPKTQGISV